MLNHVALMGRMVADPELRYTPSGVAVASFRLACEEDHGDHYVSYIDCVAWRSTAEFTRKYFTKGQMAAIVGRLKQERWTDRDSGHIRSKLEIVCDNVYFASSKPGNGQNEPEPEPEEYDEDEYDPYAV